MCVCVSYFLDILYSVTEANTKFCFLCFWALAIVSIVRQEINKGRADSSPALLFIELKASGMTGITNSSNQLFIYSQCASRSSSVSLLTVSSTKG